MATTRIFDVGRVGIVFRGNWSATVADYAFLDTVYYSGSLWINIDTSGNTPIGTLPTDTTYWKLYVQGSDPSRLQNIEMNVNALELNLASVVNTVEGLAVKPELIEVDLSGGSAYTVGTSYSYYFKNAYNEVTVNIRFTTLTHTQSTTSILLGYMPVGYRPKTVSVYGIGYAYNSAGSPIRGVVDTAINVEGAIYFYGLSASTSYQALTTNFHYLADE